MVNKSMLRSFMAKFDETQNDLAKALGLSLSRVNAKINGWQGADFTEAEMEFIRNRYHMSREEGALVFYPKSI